ncbi:acyltransferase family protein [Adhaeribacter soli]|uniref:Acyltransferase n=1 Tax=Adhaeribacter soli TaxID=2607655 RepID=A0A5N1IS66_9BACT|nr:acyltransferase [Adhaeribacter soli]KAA9327349.1 acyltransferase [Adhaeribacter soli]
MNKPFLAPVPNKSIQDNSRPIYLPGLNGIRAIAAVAVVVSHITLSLNEFGLDSKIFGTDQDGNARGLDLAGNGVTIFFTLSGFLITYLILKEKEVSEVKIKEFYLRRVLRIWPLYYLYFFVCLITIILYSIPIEKSAIPYYIFLAANIPFIIGTTLPLVGHFWSLGVEEQFYLFFPQIARFSNRKLLMASIALLLIFLILKAVFWVIRQKSGFDLPLLAISVTRFHIMLIGVIGAILYYYKQSHFLAVSTHKLTQAISWGCIFLIAINRFHIASVIDSELIATIAVFLIIGQITRKNNLINLDNKVCDFIGKISYGIYVIHPLLIFLFAKLIGRFESATVLNYLTVYFSITAITILLSYISYEFYEKRFLKLKAKYSVIKSSNSRNGADH